MRLRSVLTGAVLGATVLLGSMGCEFADPPKTGVVTDNWHHAAYDNIWYSTTCWSYDSNFNCTYATRDEHVEHIPERWQVEVTKDANDTSKSDKKGWWEIDRLGFELCSIGTRYPDCNKR